MHLVTRKVKVKSLYTAEKSWEKVLFRYVVILPSWATFQISSVSQSLLQFIEVNYFKKNVFIGLWTCVKYLYAVNIFWVLDIDHYIHIQVIAT